MAFRQYTQCYSRTPGSDDKPFRKSDLFGFAVGAALPGLIGGLLASGALPPPYSSIGFFAGIGVAYAQAITAVANAWLYHRLVCLGPDPKCAVGVVQSNPRVGDLGDFDNDEFFNVRLMPHRAGDLYSRKNEKFLTSEPGPTYSDVAPAGQRTSDHPANDLYLDGFLGQELLRPDDDLRKDLGYVSESDEDFQNASTLHCEAEGNFWVKMKEWAPGLAVVTAVAAAGGAAAGCAIGFSIFGVIGCVIGAIIGALLGIGAVHLVASIAAFNSDPGDVEDANVGDSALGTIGAGDMVAVLGRHVYDGFHAGWHEFHPLMAVQKLPAELTGQYLEWDPVTPESKPFPADDNPTLPADAKGLTKDDFAVGLESKTFRNRCTWLRNSWCELLQEAFSPTTRGEQANPKNGWTIHPSVDGCDPADSGDPGGGPVIH